MIKRRILIPLALMQLCAMATAADLPNVLFIAVDDLRPEIMSFGKKVMITPNLDRLANRSVMFQNAYCMVPTCGASRASLMTSIRPARDRFTSFKTYASVDAPGITTLNSHFKNNGYHTVSLGKVFHHPDDNEDGWSEKPWRPAGGQYANQKNKQPHDGSKNGTPYEREDVPDETYNDSTIATRAVEDLRRLSAKDKPFFLAVGFLKPHLPFIAPDKYWDLYDGQVTLPGNYYPPQNVPGEAMHTWGELRQYAGIPKQGILPEEQAQVLIHGYRACVSYTDAQIGRLLDEMDTLRLWDNTIVILWGDHGWSLGEHTLWCKHCCFENALRAPLLVSAPTLREFKGGQQTSALTEFIDIYPTLCELAGIAVPGHVQGKSFLKVLGDPQSAHKEFAISRFQDGDSIRTGRYRFTQYSTTAGKPVSRMLYDHLDDPEENINIAENPENKQLVDTLSKLLTENMGR